MILVFDGACKDISIDTLTRFLTQILSSIDTLWLCLILILDVCQVFLFHVKLAKIVLEICNLRTTDSSHLFLHFKQSNFETCIKMNIFREEMVTLGCFLH